MDGRIMRRGTISSRQPAGTSETVKRFWSRAVLKQVNLIFHTFQRQTRELQSSSAEIERLEITRHGHVIKHKLINLPAYYLSVARTSDIATYHVRVWRIIASPATKCKRLRVIA